ncbi:MAG: GTPase domain-containing protein [Clostridiales bacterium]|nr:GTPase domain-containing protein [Clostridiales bacterium]
MSEFYFDYKCIAMNSTAKGAMGTDKALDFYLFQDYDHNDGAMCVQVYVPRAMQVKYCGARLYSLTNGVELPDFVTATNYEFIPCGTAAGLGTDTYNIAEDSCIFIKSKNGELSGSGVIAFIEGNDRNATPKVENAYKYVINYAKKETISYRIIESKAGLNIQVIYPLIRNDIALRVIKKTGAKPVLIRDRMGEDNLLMTKNGPATITLKANGRIEDVVKAHFKAANTNKADFRLIFEDLTNNKYYILVDESDYTIEDKDIRIREERNKHKLVNNERRCPYCGEVMGPLEARERGSSQLCGCDGEAINDARVFDQKLAGKRTIVCKADLPQLSNPAYTLNSRDDEGFIPVRRLIIPDDYVRLPSMNVVVVGATKSGKTIYLSSLMNMKNGGTSKGVYSDPFILNRITNAFDKKGKEEKRVIEVPFDNVNIVGGEAQLGDECERLRSSPMDKIKRRYVISTGGKVESFTDPRDAFRLSWHPVGYQMGNLGYIYFYDVPGEKFRRDVTDKVRAVDMADCFLAVIDGANPSGAKGALNDLQTALQQIPKLSTRDIDMENIPIAIVFTKHDLKLADYAKEGDLVGLQGRFDENCHVVREDILGMLPKNGVYGGSELERHIDCSSYELEHFLKSAGDRESVDMVNDIKTKYKNIKFFTCSALGNNMCLAESDDDSKEVLFRPRRMRMELPIIWLMYQKGLIRR